MDHEYGEIHVMSLRIGGYLGLLYCFLRLDEEVFRKVLVFGYLHKSVAHSGLVLSLCGADTFCNDVQV